MTTSTPPIDRPGFPHGSRRGSVLVVALLVAALLSLTVASYLTLNLSTARLSRQSYRVGAAFHLAEAGAEEALWSMNRAHAAAPDAWWNWTVQGKAAWRKFSGFDFGGGTSGYVKVYLNNTAPAGKEQTTAVAQAVVEADGMPPASRMLELTFARRSYFANAIVAKEALQFAGTNTSVDSWNSDPDHDPATPAVPYSPSLKSDAGSIATNAVQNNSLLVNQADIWGYVATGGAPPEVGVNGSIKGTDSPPNIQIDPAHVSTDFVAELPLVAAPSDGTVITTVGPTLGTSGQATRWRCPSIDLQGNATLTILGDVTLVLTVSTGTALLVTGNATLIIPAGSSLTLYAEADIKIAGQGLANANPRPGSCRIFGTNPEPHGQGIHVAGKGALLGTIYAPNADVAINGNGDIMGAIVADKITFTGNASFHYDLSLADGDDTVPLGVKRWRELTNPADRAVWDPVFAGW